MADLIKLMRRFFYSTELFELAAIFMFVYIFFEKYFNFGVFFLSVPHLVDIYARNAHEWGRNFMCKRILPSLIVCLKLGSPI